MDDDINIKEHKHMYDIFWEAYHQDWKYVYMCMNVPEKSEDIFFWCLKTSSSCDKAKNLHCFLIEYCLI